ncbi:MAG TPA: DUF1634 domain-containing protein [Candidatus Limnocylindrales bacterium]|nr:DUF1634 domain-containing protein [Candidatus Limnocylindrales bacterium]
MAGDRVTTASPRSLESSIGRLLTIGTYVSVGLIAIGTVLLIGSGRSPLDAAPALDLSRLIPDLLGVQPAGFLWLGILGVVATPAARVAAALVGFSRSGERRMALVAAAILIVIAIGVVTGTAAS